MRRYYSVQVWPPERATPVLSVKTNTTIINPNLNILMMQQKPTMLRV